MGRGRLCHSIVKILLPHLAVSRRCFSFILRLSNPSRIWASRREEESVYGIMLLGGGLRQNPHFPNDAMVWSQQCLWYTRLQ